MATKNEMRDEMIKVVSEMITLEAKTYTYKNTREGLGESKRILANIKHDAEQKGDE